jgi:hypothetical protein
VLPVDPQIEVGEGTVLAGVEPDRATVEVRLAAEEAGQHARAEVTEDVGEGVGEEVIRTEVSVPDVHHLLGGDLGAVAAGPMPEGLGWRWPAGLGAVDPERHQGALEAALPPGLGILPAGLPLCRGEAN